MQRKSAIFDMDGTLVATKPFHVQAWRDMRADGLISASDDDILFTFGQTNQSILRAFLGEGPDPEQIRELADEKEHRYREIARGNLTWVPGAPSLLQSLRSAGYRTGLATSAPAENVQMVSQMMELNSLFDVIVGEEDITHSKPHPEIFLTAAHKLEVPPYCCVVFEDSLGGVAAAKAAGMKCVAVTTTLPRGQLSESDLVVEDFVSVDAEVIDRLLI